MCSKSSTGQRFIFPKRLVTKSILQSKPIKLFYSLCATYRIIQSTISRIIALIERITCCITQPFKRCLSICLFIPRYRRSLTYILLLVQSLATCRPRQLSFQLLTFNTRQTEQASRYLPTQCYIQNRTYLGILTSKVYLPYLFL